MTRQERLELFYQRLRELPKLQTHDEALAAIQEAMNAVEDEFSGLEKHPTEAAPTNTSGRMYPPHKNFEKPSDRPGMRLYVQRGHWTYIGEDGRIVIVDRRSVTIVFEKE